MSTGHHYICLLRGPLLTVLVQYGVNDDTVFRACPGDCCAYRMLEVVNVASFAAATLLPSTRELQYSCNLTTFLAAFFSPYALCTLPPPSPIAGTHLHVERPPRRTAPMLRERGRRRNHGITAHPQAAGMVRTLCIYVLGTSVHTL